MRLKVINEFLPDEEITETIVFYGRDFFDDNSRNCKCPNWASIKLKRAPSRHRPLELLAVPESCSYSRFFNFVFARGRDGTDSPPSNEENLRAFPARVW